MQQYLNEIEIEKIEAFCKDEILLEAVKKVLLQGLYTHGVNHPGQKAEPLLNGAFSLVSMTVSNPIPNELLGEQLKAQWAGINTIHNAFESLKSIRSDKKDEVESPYNIAE